jgi:hypothetical protein
MNKGKNGGFDYAYNAKMSVDADLQIIVGLHTRCYTNRRTINCHSAEILKNLIQIKSDVSKPRPKHPKPHRKRAYKSTC